MTDHLSPVHSQDRIAEIRQLLSLPSDSHNARAIYARTWGTAGAEAASDLLSEVDRLLAENARLRGDDTPKHVEDSLHAVFTAHGIASRSDYSQTLVGDLIRWAADACRRASKRELTELRAQLAQAEQENARLSEGWDGARNEARQWADEQVKWRKRAEQAESERTALQERLTRLEGTLQKIAALESFVAWPRFDEPLVRELQHIAKAALSPAEDAR